MMKTILVAVAVVIAAVLIFVFGFSNKSESPTPTEQTQPVSDTAPPQNTESQDTAQPQSDESAPQAVTIIYTDRGFSQNTYKVAAGGTVTVQNDSGRVLEFSSDNHPSHTKNPELNMDALQPGGTTQFTVQQSGSWGFHNHLQASHTGILTVEQ